MKEQDEARDTEEVFPWTWWGLFPTYLKNDHCSWGNLHAGQC